MFEGGVETLAYFSKQMAEQFVKMGYAVFFYNLKDEKGSAKRLRKFIKPGETVMITFNFQGLEKEDGVYSEKSGYVWDEYKIPCYNIAADHPYYYDNRLHDLPKGYHHISIDRKQEAYFLKYYPEYQSFGFLPLAGTGLDGALEVPYEKRDIDVIMTGNYTPPSFFEQHINWINDEYAAFYRGIIEELLEKTDQTVEEAALRHCEREMGEVAPDGMTKVYSTMKVVATLRLSTWIKKANPISTLLSNVTLCLKTLLLMLTVRLISLIRAQLKTLVFLILSTTSKTSLNLFLKVLTLNKLFSCQLMHSVYCLRCLS